MPKRALGNLKQATSGGAKPGRRSNTRVMNAATDVMGRTWSGIEDVGREVGATALAAVRGTMHTAEQIGGDLLSAAQAAVAGAIDAAERIGGATNRAVKQIVNAQKTPRKKAASPSRTKRSSRGMRTSKPVPKTGDAAS